MMVPDRMGRSGRRQPTHIIGILVLVSGRGANLNMRVAFLEVVNDTLGSVAVLVAAAVIATTGWLQADAVASLVIAALIIPRTLKLLGESVDVLLESTPRGSTCPRCATGS